MSVLRSTHLLLLMLSVGAGCSPAAKKSAATDLAPESLALDDQIAAVRAKQTHEIVLRQATDQDLARLKNLAGLEILELEQAEVSAVGLAYMATAPDLIKLTIRPGQAQIGDDEADVLADLQGLRFLNLPRTAITDEGLSHLSRLTNLKQLRLGASAMTDAGMKPIAGLPALRFLHLIDAPITDAGLPPLYNMKTLESFYLDGARATDKGLAALLKARPDLHFHENQRHVDFDPQRGHDGADP